MGAVVVAVAAAVVSAAVAVVALLRARAMTARLCALESDTQQAQQQAEQVQQAHDDELKRTQDELVQSAAAAAALRSELQACASGRRVVSIVESTGAIPFEFARTPAGAPLTFAYVGAGVAAAVPGFTAEAWCAPGFLAANLVAHERDAKLAELASLLRSPAAGVARAVDVCVLAVPRQPRWLRLHCWTVDTSSGRIDSVPNVVVRGVAVDVTAERAAEVERRMAQKLESVARLAEGLAHEVNTPLGYVQNSVTFLEEGLRALRLSILKTRQLRAATLANGSGASPVLVALAKAGQRDEEKADIDYFLDNFTSTITDARAGLTKIASVVKSMHSFAQPGFAQANVAIDLNQQLRALLQLAKPALQSVEVEAHLGRLPLVCCHGGEINEALLHIVVNAAQAIHATGRGKGTVTLSSEHEPERDAVVVRVADDGAGIPEHIRDRVFDPFFTTKDVGAKGEGLTIARAIVAKHGGTIELDSTVGVGTTFTVRLPVGSAAEEQGGAVVTHVMDRMPTKPLRPAMRPMGNGNARHVA